MIEYNAHELWMGEVYPPLTIEKEERHNKSQDLLRLCKEKLDKINHEGEPLNEKNSFIKNWPTHISLPLLFFKIGEMVITCKIRFNPCWSYPERGNHKHHSKVFVILGSNNKCSSNNLSSQFKVLTDLAESLHGIIRQEILTQIHENEQLASEYKVIAKNVGIPLSDKNDMVDLFGGSNDVEKLKRLLEDDRPKNLVRNILRLHNGKKVEGNIIDMLKSRDIYWRVIRCNPSLVYGMEIQDNNVAKFTGFAGFVEKGTFEILHSLFKPIIIRIINSL